MAVVLIVGTDKGGTSGQLFASRDCGDSWSTLPKILCVEAFRI